MPQHSSSLVTKRLCTTSCFRGNTGGACERATRWSGSRAKYDEGLESRWGVSGREPFVGSERSEMNPGKTLSAPPWRSRALHLDLGLKKCAENSGHYLSPAVPEGSST